MIKYLGTTLMYSSPSQSEFVVTGDDRETFYDAMMNNSTLDLGRVIADKRIGSMKVVVYAIDRREDEDRVKVYHVNY